MSPDQVKVITLWTAKIEMKDLIMDKAYSQKVKGKYLIILHERITLMTSSFEPYHLCKNIICRFVCRIPRIDILIKIKGPCQQNKYAKWM